MADQAMAVANGKTVKFHYTLTVDKQVFDSSAGREPLTYTQGQGQIIPGLEKRLEGMKAGDKKTVTIPPAEAYGAAEPNAVVEVPSEKLPEGTAPGTMLNVNGGPQGQQQMRATVKEIRKETALLDFNHPLAGKELQFAVEIVDVH